jgi:glutathionyl-hydroquinone reductase
VAEACSAEGVSVRLTTPSKQIANKRQFDSQDGTSPGGQCLYWRVWQPGDSSLWHLIYKWVGISFISPDMVTDHFHHFGHLAGLPRYSHIYLKVIWHSTVWVIWKERNNRIFKNKAQDLIKLLDYVKFMSFSWLKPKLLTTAFSYNDWWRNPLLCMGIKE